MNRKIPFGFALLLLAGIIWALLAIPFAFLMGLPDEPPLTDECNGVYMDCERVFGPDIPCRQEKIPIGYPYCTYQPQMIP